MLWLIFDTKPPTSMSMSISLMLLYVWDWLNKLESYPSSKSPAVFPKPRPVTRFSRATLETTDDCYWMPWGLVVGLRRFGWLYLAIPVLVYYCSCVASLWVTPPWVIPPWVTRPWVETPWPPATCLAELRLNYPSASFPAADILLEWDCSTSGT